MRGAVGTALRQSIFGDAVPVAHETQVPRLIEVVVGRFPIDQSVFFIIAASTDSETVTRQRAADSFAGLVLVRVPPVGKAPDRGKRFKRPATRNKRFRKRCLDDQGETCRAYQQLH